MHIPDGFLSAPVAVAGYAASAAVLAAAVKRSGQTLDERRVPLLGVTTAFVFAAQMLNFPVAMGTSGHFLGATLAALLLGPLNAVLVFAAVLAVQALLFADGGLTALGANMFNMGVLGTLGGYAVFRVVRALLPRSRRAFLCSAALAAWGSVVVSAAACAVELGLSGTVPLRLVLPAMGAVHAIIGAGEALITVATLSVILAARPDVVGEWSGGAPSPRTVAESLS